MKEGGLARLVFGKGEPSEEAKDDGGSSEEGKLVPIMDDSGSSEGSAQDKGVVEHDEIQVDLADDEKKLLVAETEEEKRKFIETVFIRPLLRCVFKFVDEKQAMDSKRKTWNLKH